MPCIIPAGRWVGRSVTNTLVGMIQYGTVTNTVDLSDLTNKSPVRGWGGNYVSLFKQLNGMYMGAGQWAASGKSAYKKSSSLINSASK